jgi:hypothetical protein
VLAELRLAENAVTSGDGARAAGWLGTALAHADLLVERTHAPVDVGQLDVLLFAAQLEASAHTPLPFDLKKRLEQAHRALLGQPRGPWRTYLMWLEVYLGLIAPT